MSNKPLAPSRALAAKLLFATFNILKDAGGSLTGKEVITKIESSVELGEWDKSVYEKQVTRAGYPYYISSLSMR